MAHQSLIRDGGPRFVEQPIFDTGKKKFDEDGNEIGYEQVGVRQYDLAPEWTFVMEVKNDDGSYRPLDSRTLLGIRKHYAWEKNHPFSRIRFEQQREREQALQALADETYQELSAKEEAFDEKLRETAREAIREHENEIWGRVSVAVP